MTKTLGGVVMAGGVLLVASAGGHLEELYQLRGALIGSETPVTWVSSDSPQSRSVLDGEADVRYLKRVGSRGYLSLLRSLWPALRLLRQARPVAVYSTGAGIALAFLPFAWIVGARATYVESAARTAGPSWTGRLLSFLPWIRLKTQYRGWADERWHFAGSVFDGYVVAPTQCPPKPIRRVVVTLGTQEGYPFVSLVERVQQIVPEDVEVLWQVGPGFPESERPAGARDLVTAAELRDWVRSADAVVTHAGVGSALTLLESGHTPVLVPRSSAQGEHVDEHQQLIAHELTTRGLAVSASPLALSWADLELSTTTVPRHAGARSRARR